MKGGMLCGAGISDTKLSGDLARLLSKLCRVSVPLPAPKQQHALSKSAGSHPRRGRNNSNSNNKFERSSSKTNSQSWDPSMAATQINGSSGAREKNITILGRHDSLKLLSERCSTAPAPAYDLHKPRKIRTHEPHQHFYRTISKTLDQKLKYVVALHTSSIELRTP